jgi:hypothetical protein
MNVAVRMATVDWRVVDVRKRTAPALEARGGVPPNYAP